MVTVGSTKIHINCVPHIPFWLLWLTAHGVIVYVTYCCFVLLLFNACIIVVPNACPTACKVRNTRDRTPAVIGYCPGIPYSNGRSCSCSPGLMPVDPRWQIVSLLAVMVTSALPKISILIVCPRTFVLVAVVLTAHVVIVYVTYCFCAAVV